MDRERNVGGFVGEVGSVADIVFVEAGDNAVAGVGDMAVQAFLGSAEPVVLVLEGFCVSAEFVADVEVAVAQGSVEDTAMHPVPVHAEGTEEYFLVMAAQIVVKPEQAFGLQLEEHGIDELYHVVASHPREQTVEPDHQEQPSNLAWTTGHVDIAWVVFPEVTVGYDDHLVSQRPQSLCEGGMHVAVFTEQ